MHWAATLTVSVAAVAAGWRQDSALHHQSYHNSPVNENSLPWTHTPKSTHTHQFWFVINLVDDNTVNG